MGLSKHRRHRSQLSEESLELFMPVPQRHVLEPLNSESPRARALGHGAGKQFLEPLGIAAGWPYEPIVEVSLRPKVLRRNENPTANAEVLGDRNRSVRSIAVERHVHAPAAPEKRLVLARPSLGAVDAAGGNTGQQYAQRIWDPLA